MISPRNVRIPWPARRLFLLSSLVLLPGISLSYFGWRKYRKFPQQLESARQSLEERRGRLEALQREPFELRPVEAEVISATFQRQRTIYRSEPIYEYVQVPSGYGKVRTYRTEQRIKGYRQVRDGTESAHWSIWLQYRMEGKSKHFQRRLGGIEHAAPVPPSDWEPIDPEAGMAVTKGNRYRFSYNPILKEVHTPTEWKDVRQAEIRSLLVGSKNWEEWYWNMKERGPKTDLLWWGGGVGLTGLLFLELGLRRRRFVRRLIRDGIPRTVEIERIRDGWFRFRDREAQPPVEGIWRLGRYQDFWRENTEKVRALVDPKRPGRYYPLVHG